MVGLTKQPGNQERTSRVLLYLDSPGHHSLHGSHIYKFYPPARVPRPRPPGDEPATDTREEFERVIDTGISTTTDTRTGLEYAKEGTGTTFLIPVSGPQPRKGRRPRLSVFRRLVGNTVVGGKVRSPYYERIRGGHRDSH